MCVGGGGVGGHACVCACVRVGVRTNDGTIVVVALTNEQYKMATSQ